MIWGLGKENVVIRSLSGTFQIQRQSMRFKISLYRKQIRFGQHLISVLYNLKKMDSVEQRDAGQHLVIRVN